jgi:aminoglycoside phosphotransferase
MIRGALDDARRRVAPRPAARRIEEHLRTRYGIDVSALTELDLGVFRADRADGAAWVARVFPATRPGSATAGDARILRVLEDHGFPAERVATAEPLSDLDGQAVLVTEFVPGVPRADRAAAIRESGGLRRLGEMLGQLHALPADIVAAAGPGGSRQCRRRPKPGR